MTTSAIQGSANALALSRIIASEPRWVGVRSARDALGLPDRVLLHAGPPLANPRQPPPAMRNSALLACLHEGWAPSEAAAEQMIASGMVTLQPSFDHRVSIPLAAMVSAGTTLAEISDGQCTWFAFLGTGAGAQIRFGSRDRAVIERLAFRERELLPGFRDLLDSPVDLLSVARSALTEGDDLHNRLSSGNALLHAVLSTRKADSAAAKTALQTVQEAPLYFLNLWMPACALMLDAAANTPGSTLVTKMCANGEVAGIQLAGLPGRWFTAPAALVKGPFMKGAPENPQFPPATGDSGIIDAFGLGGQVLRRAPSLLAAFAPWLPDGDEARALSQVCGAHPLLGVPIALDAAAVAATGKSPLLSTGMVSADGRGLLGRGICAMPVSLFAEAAAALGK